MRVTTDSVCEAAALVIEGLSDAPRRRSVRSALEAIRGVRSVEVSEHEPSAQVLFDPTRVVPQQLRLAVRAVGCRVQSIYLPPDPL